MGLHYRRKTKETRLIGYSDSDLAGDIDTRKSKSGTLFFLGNCLGSWESLKQRLVAPEYVAATTATTQGIWLARLLGELQGRNAETVELMVDNKSAMALAKNPVSMSAANISIFGITSSEAAWKMEASAPASSTL
jgi:hypothetical protein